VSSNLMALCLSSVGLLLPHVTQGVLSTPAFVLVQPYVLLGFDSAFRGPLSSE
jgi:hypothetical protein